MLGRGSAASTLYGHWCWTKLSWALWAFPPTAQVPARGMAKHWACVSPKHPPSAGAPRPAVRAVGRARGGRSRRGAAAAGRAPDPQTVTPGLRCTPAAGVISPLAYKELWYLLVLQVTLSPLTQKLYWTQINTLFLQNT